MKPKFVNHQQRLIPKNFALLVALFEVYQLAAVSLFLLPATWRLGGFLLAVSITALGVLARLLARCGFPIAVSVSVIYDDIFMEPDKYIKVAGNITKE